MSTPMNAATNEAPAREPLTPAHLLTTASTLVFRATTRDRSGSTLGVLVNVAAHQHLSMTAEGAWTPRVDRLPYYAEPVRVR